MNKKKMYCKAAQTCFSAFVLYLVSGLFICTGFAFGEITRDQDDSILNNIRAIYGLDKTAFMSLFGGSDSGGYGTPGYTLQFLYGESFRVWNEDGTPKGTITINSYENLFKKMVDDSLTMGAGALWTKYFQAGRLFGADLNPLAKTPYEVDMEFKLEKDDAVGWT